MAKGSRRGGRVRDKWRDKQWIIVNAPPAFEQVPLNYIPVSDLPTAKGRVIENTLYDVLKQDPTQHQTKIFVQIDKINAGIATTIFKGHEYAKEFLRSLIRRGSSMINYVNDYTTSDGYVFRVSATAFSQRRINSSKQHEIRITMRRVLGERIPQLTLNEFVKEVTMGKMGSDLMEISKKIAVIRHLGIRKTKLISAPMQDGVNNTDVLSGDKIESEEDDITDDSMTESSDIDNTGDISSSSSSTVTDTTEDHQSESNNEQHSSSST
jgi:small subunit ribosomal protein S3Ae